MVIELNPVKGLVDASWRAPAKPCYFCKSGASSVFCCADSAFLCLSCDANIHGASKLASRHDRVLLCEVCEQAPAAVTCKADAAALCVTCDVDIHSANPLAQRHERVPVQPFFTSSAESSAFNLLLVPSDTTSHHCSEDASGGSSHHHHDVVENSQAMLFSETDDPFLNFEYPKSIDSSFQHHHHSAGGTDSVVPVHTKPLISHHLSEINCFNMDFCRSKLSNFSVSSTSVEVGVVPDGNMKVEATQLCGMDREARVLRYREKRKNRKFEKTIRYASRKAYAETRPRVKGRFAKRTETGAGTACVYGTAASAVYLRDSQYGVVPSF